jgi:hypothetical protein
MRFQQQGDGRVLEPEGRDVVDVDAVLGGYDGWLTRQPLAARTRNAYLAQVRDFVTWLAGSEHGARARIAATATAVLSLAPEAW